MWDILRFWQKTSGFLPEFSIEKLFSKNDNDYQSKINSMQKKENLKVRIDKMQKDDVVNFCQKAGINQSEFIRDLIKKRDIKSIKIFTSEERESLEKLNDSLKKIGTNINQISHFLNLEHLKSFDSFKSIEDIFILDKLKESQIISLKNDVDELKKNLRLVNIKLEESYERKA